MTKHSTLTFPHDATGIRPDFILTNESSAAEAYTCEHVLVVGEHESKGSLLPEHGLPNLASYAEQVFVAQQSRAAVFGLITSNSSPVITFWRFNRAGEAIPLGIYC